MNESALNKVWNAAKNAALETFGFIDDPYKAARSMPPKKNDHYIIIALVALVAFAFWFFRGLSNG